MDESAEAPECGDRNAAASAEPFPTDGEPASLAEKAKNLYERRKPWIRAAVTLGVGLGLVMVANRVERQGGEGRGTEDAGSSEPVSNREAADKPRRSAPYPARDPFVRKLPSGQQASQTAMDNYRDQEGGDLPVGHTFVSR